MSVPVVAVPDDHNTPLEELPSAPRATAGGRVWFWAARAAVNVAAVSKSKVFMDMRSRG
jgi:hypothetical protein